VTENGRADGGAMIDQDERRLRARMTVVADRGLPFGVSTFAEFRMRATSRAGFALMLVEMRLQRPRPLDCGLLGSVSIIAKACLMP
jgi:hypothetical protein